MKRKAHMEDTQEVRGAYYLLTPACPLHWTSLVLV